jgi:hypothetical protein
LTDVDADALKDLVRRANLLPYLIYGSPHDLSIQEKISGYYLLVLFYWRKLHGFIWKRPYHSVESLPSGLRFRGRTLGFSCCRKPERGTSGGWRQSAANPCWALVVAQGCAGTSRPPRPTPARRTVPPRRGSPPPGRTCPPRVGARVAWTPPRVPRPPPTRRPPASARQARPTRATRACGQHARPTPRSRAEGRPPATAGARGAPPAPAARGRTTDAGRRRPGDQGARLPWGTRGRAERSCRPGHVSCLALVLPWPWRHAPLVAGSLHALEERRPVGGCLPSWRDALAEAPGLGRGLWGFPSRARGAQRQPSPAAGSRSDAGA